jgi:hypothetical protein
MFRVWFDKLINARVVDAEQRNNLLGIQLIYSVMFYVYLFCTCIYSYSACHIPWFRSTIRKYLLFNPVLTEIFFGFLITFTVWFSP